MIVDRENIKNLLKLISTEDLIEVLFDEEIICEIREEELMRHLVEHLGEVEAIEMALDINDNSNYDKMETLEILKNEFN